MRAPDFFSRDFGAPKFVPAARCAHGALGSFHQRCMAVSSPTLRCPGCKEHKDPSSFWRNVSSPSGRAYYCIPCQKDHQRRWRAARLAKPTPSTTASEMSDSESDGGVVLPCVDAGCAVRDATPPRADTGSTSEDALYVIRYSFDPCGTMGVKIGRAACVQTRVRQLEASHNFRLIVLATFPGLGYLEPRVHSMLSESRAREGRGREWFGAPLDTVLHVIALATRDRAGLQFEGPKS